MTEADILFFRYITLIFDKTCLHHRNQLAKLPLLTPFGTIFEFHLYPFKTTTNLMPPLSSKVPTDPGILVKFLA